VARVCAPLLLLLLLRRCTFTHLHDAKEWRMMRNIFSYPCQTTPKAGV
jgi:hypothetical protein